MMACPFISNSERDFFPGSSSAFKRTLSEPSSVGSSCIFNQLSPAWWELIWTMALEQMGRVRLRGTSISCQRWLWDTVHFWGWSLKWDCISCPLCYPWPILNRHRSKTLKCGSDIINNAYQVVGFIVVSEATNIFCRCTQMRMSGLHISVGVSLIPWKNMIWNLISLLSGAWLWELFLGASKHHVTM